MNRGLMSTVHASVAPGLVTLALGICLQATQARPAPVLSPQGSHTENGLAGYAKILCSGVFISGRSPEDVAHGSAYFFMPLAEQAQVKWTVDREARLARASLGSVTREARYYGDQGCIIQQPGQPGIHFTPVTVTTRLPDADSQLWPMGDRDDSTPLPATINRAKLEAALDAAFAEPAMTAAFLVVHKGRIIAERYGPGINKDTQLESWSMGKSLAATLFALLVKDGTYTLEEPAPVPLWRSPGDPRGAIRNIDLLRMSAGLKFLGNQEPGSTQTYPDHYYIYTGAVDAFEYSVTRPPEYPPNTDGRYRNSDPLTVAYLTKLAVTRRGESILTWPQRALFDRIGIRRQVLETDPHGNFLITGYDYGTARNWARFGMLYLQDGVWQGERILPEGWAKFVSTPAPAWKRPEYGGLFWLNRVGTWNLPPETYFAAGAGGQNTWIVPTHDLVIVRMGHMRGQGPARQATNAALALILEAIGSQQAPTAPARPSFRDGQAQVVPAFEEASTWVREKLWVETEFDSDRDGRKDRVFVDVTRPRQTDTEGLKVPVIYESSPYFAGTSGDRQFLWDVRQELGTPPPPRTSQPPIAFKPARDNVSTSLVSTWVPRGFAVVHSDAPGTGLSQGCVTVGAEPEQLAPKAVVDWLNRRAQGFRTIDGNETVAARWSTGKVGMTGTSYNGTIPLAAAVTGVRGLEAIIPVAPNTSYYHYYRSNGLVRHPGGWLGEDIDFLYDFVNSGDPARREHCDRLYRDGEFARGRDRMSGDYNDFWRARDLRTKVKKIRAAVLMAHAFNDWNVVPEHSVRIYEALKGRVPLRAYFHQGGHGGPPPLEMMNRWFTRFLYGVENGVEREPKGWIVREAAPGAEPTPPPAVAGSGRGRAATPAPVAYKDYPNPEAKPVTFHLGAGGGRVGQLTVERRRDRGRETLVDNVELSGAALASASASPHRLLYASAELTAPLHVSGTPRVTIRLASSKPAANLSVWLVVLPWTDGPIGPANLITRGWADPQNYRSLRRGGNYDSSARGEPLQPGRFYDVTFDLQPDDQIIPAGQRIGLMIFSSDRDFTLWPAAGTELTIDLDRTTLRLPVVGARDAVRGAGVR